MESILNGYAFGVNKHVVAGCETILLWPITKYYYMY